MCARGLPLRARGLYQVGLTALKATRPIRGYVRGKKTRSLGVLETPAQEEHTRPSTKNKTKTESLFLNKKRAWASSGRVWR